MNSFLRKLIVGITLIIIGTAIQSKASHVIGADITWKCLGNDSFEVNLNVYRNCTGIDLGTPNLNTVCKSGGSGNSISTTQKGSKTVTDVTPTCQSSCTQCSSSGCNFQFGIEKHTVKYIVDLSNSSCCKVGFRYSSCCRSTKFSSANLFVESWVDRCKAPCNNSPTFKEPPIGLLCKDDKFIYNHGVTDEDTGSTGGLQDSLSYSFARPMKGASSYITYPSPYSYKNPIKYKGFPSRNLPFPWGLHFDKVTGQMKVVPTKQQTSVMAFKFNEYRDTNGDGKNGAHIGQIRRDLKVSVLSCPNNGAPEVIGMKCQKIDTYEEICAGNQRIFDFCTSDANSKDSVDIEFNRGNLPASSKWSVIDTSRLESGKLKWKPGAKDVSQIPYEFYVSASDENCPMKGRTSQIFRLKVNPEPKVNYQVKKLGCGKVKFIATPVNGDNPSYLWQGQGGLNGKDSVIVHKYSEPGEYPFTLTYSDYSCQKVFKDTVKLDSFLHINVAKPSDTLLCKSSNLTLDAEVYDSAGNVSYLWHDNVSGTSEQTFTGIEQDSLITLRAKDTVCTARDSLQVLVKESPDIDLGIDSPRVCKTDSLRLSVDSTYASYTWNTGDTGYFVLADTQRKYEVNAIDTLGCQAKDSVAVRTLDTAIAIQNITSCNQYQWPLTGKTYTKSGQYSTQKKNTDWCDSLRTHRLNLEILDSSHSIFQRSACRTYKVPSGDEVYKQSGTYKDTIPNKAGCDSVITINLTINRPQTVTDTVKACRKYTWPVNGKLFRKSGFYSDTFTDQNGCDSFRNLKLTIADTSGSALTVNTCNRYTVPSGDETYTQSGTYQDTLTNYQGCDSFIIITVKLDSVNLGITRSGNTLIARAKNAQYQWLNCSNGYTPITGETNRTYDPPINGNYAVKVTKKGCTDTSRCISINTIGFLENEFGERLNVYPNPTQGKVTVVFKEKQQALQGKMLNAEGKKVKSFKKNDVRKFNLTLPEAEGYYFITLKNKSGAQARIKILKN